MTQNLDPQPTPLPGNALALISVISGLLLCIPLTGLIAVPTGIIGYRRSKYLGGNGSVAARVGLVLGIINLVWWPAMIAGAFNTYRSFQLSKPAIEPTQKFVMYVGSGQIANAKKLCTDAIDEARLTDSAEEMGKWGSIDNVNPYYRGEYHGKSDIEIQAELKFDNAHKILVTHWTTTDAGPRLTAYDFREPPTTEPSTQP